MAVVAVGVAALVALAFVLVIEPERPDVGVLLLEREDGSLVVRDLATEMDLEYPASSLPAEIGTGAVPPDGAGALSPDGRRFAYVAEWPAPLNVLDIASGRTTELDLEWVSEISWSPDGRRVAALASAPGDTLGRQVLFVVDLESGKVTRNRQLPRGGYDALTWSPDSETILVFASFPPELFGLVRVTDDDAVVLPIRDVETAGGVSWSPDGSMFAFATNPQILPQDEGNAHVACDDRSAKVFVASSDGSQVHRLTTSVAPEGSPIWSPDGEWIAFYSTRDASEPTTFCDPTRLSGGEIWVAHPDGSDIQVLVGGDDPVGGMPIGWTAVPPAIPPEDGDFSLREAPVPTSGGR